MRSVNMLINNRKQERNLEAVSEDFYGLKPMGFLKEEQGSVAWML